MTKINDAQEAMLAFASQEYRLYQSLEKTIDAELAMEKERRLGESRKQAQQALQRAIEAGIPQRQVFKRGMGVADRNTFLRFMKGSRPLPVPPEPGQIADPLLPRNLAGIYDWDDEGEQVIVHLDEARHRKHFDAAHSGGAFGFDWETVAADPALNRALFTRDGDPITEDWMPSRHDRHPLVVLYTSVPELRAELIGEAA